MTGYQESVTDPSYNSQIITFTYPLIGNYGVSDVARQSDRVHASAVIMREARNNRPESTAGWLDWLEQHGIPAISGVDTRALVRHAVFLASGPGDPAALDHVVGTVRELVGKVPVFGICLGHQLLCRAVGLDTFKLRFGHRGANHPVKDLATGKIEITAQNHG